MFDKAWQAQRASHSTVQLCHNDERDRWGCTRTFRSLRIGDTQGRALLLGRGRGTIFIGNFPAERGSVLRDACLQGGPCNHLSA